MRILGALAGLAVLVAHSCFALAEPITTHSGGPETDAFQSAQARVMTHYGVKSRSRYLKLKQPALTLHVLEAGRGEPVILVHGGGGFAAQMAPLIGSLQKDFRVFAFDRPGCGLSDKFDYHDTMLRQHAVDLLTNLLDGLRLRKATLVANSMGGLWALQFALAKPERVSKLVLVGEPAWSAEVMTSPPPPRAGLPTVEMVRGAYAARLVADIQRVPLEVLEADLAAKRMPGAEVSWNTLLAKIMAEKSGTYHLRPELKNLRIPTLFIWGEKDRLGPPVLGQEMARMAPNARCEVLPDAGHLPWLDQPARCGQLVREFIVAPKR